MEQGQVSKKVQDRIRARYSEYDLECYALMEKKIRDRYISQVNYLAKQGKSISPSEYIKRCCTKENIYFEIPKKPKANEIVKKKYIPNDYTNIVVKETKKTKELAKKIMKLWKRKEFLKECKECKGVVND